MNNIIKIAVFKPTNIRNDNAFSTGQHIIFEKLNKNKNIEVTYFVDNKKINFKGIKVNYIKNHHILSLLFRIIRKLTGLFYFKAPFFTGVSFTDFNIVITEGLHYPLLYYLKNYNGRIIFNDSISLESMITSKKVKEFNNFFSDNSSVLVNSKIKSLYLKYNINNKLHVIGHAIDCDKIHRIIRTKFEGKIISIGRLVKEKGYDIIFKALKILDQEKINFQIDIFGEGPEKAKLKQLIIDLKLVDKINLMGYINNDLLIEKFSNYSLFISHPIDSVNVAEAFNMSQAEAMSSGIPGITTDCGGMKSVYKDSLVYSNQKNIFELSEKIKLFILNEEVFSYYSKFGSDYIKSNYDLKIIYNKWKKIIQ